MKQEGRPNTDIVPELKKLGVYYDPKTIGTRYIRIRTVVNKNQNMVNGRVWSKSEVCFLIPFATILTFTGS
jgi:hypothetical protein